MWQWSWVPGNDHANFGDNPIFDWVRVVCVIIGVMVMMAIGRILIESMRREHRLPWGQWARFVGLALAVVSISLTEVAVVGTPATPRLVVNIAALAMSLWGVRGMRNKQRRTPITSERPRRPRHDPGRPT